MKNFGLKAICTLLKKGILYKTSKFSKTSFTETAIAFKGEELHGHVIPLFIANVCSYNSM